MKWNDKEVLVIGSGGFIGSHLVDDLLGQGANVTAFVHYNAQNHWGMLEGQYCHWIAFQVCTLSFMILIWQRYIAP